jgi:hypothetical protein
MEQFPKTIILPYSGRTVVIQRRLIGRDTRMAERLAGRKADNMQRGYAMLAQVVTLDGQPVLMEDFDEWDLEDINVVYRELGLATEGEEQEKKSPTEPPSPPLSNGGSQPLS